MNKERTNHKYCVNEEFWQECDVIAKEHNMTPEEIFNRMLFVGKVIAESEAQGNRVVIIGGEGHVTKINFFKNGNGQKPPQG